MVVCFLDSALPCYSDQDTPTSSHKELVQELGRSLAFMARKKSFVRLNTDQA